MLMPSILGENLFDDFMNDFTDSQHSENLKVEKRTVWKTCKEFNEDRCKRNRERL